MMIREENYSEVIGDITPLLKFHFDETEDTDKELSPDHDVYSLMSANQTFRIWTARFLNELVGYIGFFIALHPHKSNTKYASSDLIYVDPYHRGKGLFQKILAVAENNLADDGVEVIQLGFKKPTDLPGYEISDYIYNKVIG